MTLDVNTRARARPSMRRVGRTIVGLVIAVALGAIVAPPPASAGWKDGDITNRLPSSFTVKIAEFGTGGQPGCSTWNSGWFSCTHYWLPSGKSDGEIRSPGFDTDGFMVENREYLVIAPNVTIRISAGVWTRIPDFSNVNCYQNVGGGASCTVDVRI